MKALDCFNNEQEHNIDKLLPKLYSFSRIEEADCFTCQWGKQYTYDVYKKF